MCNSQSEQNVRPKDFFPDQAGGSLGELEMVHDSPISPSQASRSAGKMKARHPGDTPSAKERMVVVVVVAWLRT